MCVDDWGKEGTQSTVERACNTIKHGEGKWGVKTFQFSCIENTHNIYSPKFQRLSLKRPTALFAYFWASVVEQYVMHYEVCCFKHGQRLLVSRQNLILATAATVCSSWQLYVLYMDIINTHYNVYSKYIVNSSQGLFLWEQKIFLLQCLFASICSMLCDVSISPKYFSFRFIWVTLLGSSSDFLAS